ncbi:MAG: NAD-dependent DNA ligase LigA [Puniceicoccales bacterium]|jgi:DNA ligase (NAD+)|nr:NAD-dependent DNA ligase LigA [Puniceicoccales bacterium]
MSDPFSQIERQKRVVMLGRLKKLRDEIIKHDLLYYRDSRPEISDFEYDCLKIELENLEKLVGSAEEIEKFSQKIGDDSDPGFVSRSHLSKMFSLDNTYNLTDLKRFDEKIRRKICCDDITYVVEPKIDGVAINLIYRDGDLLHAITRGDGIHGDDVTQNLRTIDNLPQKINWPTGFVEFRGEVFIRNDVFERINEKKIKAGEEPFANPRNLAAGTIKLLDSNLVAERQLSIILYGVGRCDGISYHNQSEVLADLRQRGFPGQDVYFLATGLDEVYEKIEKLGSIKSTLGYPTDGAVLKVNELKYHDLLGCTAKAPRWAFAYKFSPSQVESVIEAISLQVGRTGIITPVAELSPVFISGTMVSRATLHNEDEIKRKDIRLGDRVIIEKAGEIIPAILEVNLAKRDPTAMPFVFPKNCPSCGAILEKSNGDGFWKCKNFSCADQCRERILHFASRNAMDIHQLGSTVVTKLISAKLIENMSDIYGLKMYHIISMDNFGPKSSENLLMAIEASKHKDLYRLIYGLGIPSVGLQTAKDLALKFNSLDALIGATLEKLMMVPRVGEKTASDIIDFFSKKQVIATIEALRNHGVNFSNG